MARLQKPAVWVLYLLPPFAFTAFLVWLMRDVWH